jgi:hypothetical protein
MYFFTKKNIVFMEHVRAFWTIARHHPHQMCGYLHFPLAGIARHVMLVVTSHVGG